MRKRFILLHKAGSRQYVKEILSSIPQVVPKDVKMEAKSVLEDSFNAVRMQGYIEPAPIKKVAKRIVEKIMERQDATLFLCTLKDFDDYTFVHAINVSMLSAFVALRMGAGAEITEEVAIGALLHDVGKVFLPKRILRKEGKLDEQEFSFVKRHPSTGAMLVAKRFGQIPTLITYQHHERGGGAGYPEGAGRERINKWASLVTVCDVYDALTTDRPYRQRFLPYEAMRIILASTPEEFLPEVVQHFVSSLSLYPVGSFVKLNSGEVALVLEANTASCIRPKVLVLFGADGALYPVPQKIDLMQEDLFIVAAVDERNSFGKEGLCGLRL